MIPSSLHNYTPKTKVRVGLTDVEAAQSWLLKAKFELEVVGLNIKMK